MKQAGQVVLFEFPRTDAARGKLRPALLVADVPGPYDDWLICMISSRLHQHLDGFDEVVNASDDDFDRSGLKTTSVIRTGRLAVIEGDALPGAIGKISSERLKRIRANLAEWLAVEG